MKFLDFSTSSFFEVLACTSVTLEKDKFCFVQGYICDARSREIGNNNNNRYRNEIPHAFSTDRIDPHQVNRMDDSSPVCISVKPHLRESNSSHVANCCNMDSQI